MTSPAVLPRAALVDCARASIVRGSRSFAAASRLFDRTTRERVWLLYAWCRACDDLTDDQDHGGQLGGNAGSEAALAAIRTRTATALAGQPSGDWRFDALGTVAAETGLTADMAEAVIAGFALDAAGWRPSTETDLLRYCWHVAGAVGVMMAVVMGVPADDVETLDRAADLGHAFQLANIARDVVEDAHAGRCYLPAEWLEQAGLAADNPAALADPAHRAALASMAARLAALARPCRASARIGAARLPWRSRWAVLAAAGIYGAIGDEVERRGSRAWDRRVSTSALAKLGWIAVAGAQTQRRVPARCHEAAARRTITRRDLA